MKDLSQDVFKGTKVDVEQFQDRLDEISNFQIAKKRALHKAIQNFQNAEKRRSDRLASMINLTDQKYQSELHNIYSLLNRHCSTEDLIFAYDALTRRIGYSLGKDHPDFIKMKQGRKYYAEQFSWIERERALEMMKIESYK